MCAELHIERKSASHLKIWMTIDLQLGSFKFFKMTIMKEKILFLGQI